MASNRWVAIDPDILTHPLVGAGQPVAPADPARGAYSRMEAWVWIICNASFADHTVINRGRKMTLQRGDLLGAWAFLAHTFNWSAKTVRVWVERLIEDNMLQRRAIEGQKAANGELEDVSETFYGNQATILSIVNYWRFQFDDAPEGQPRGNQKGNQYGNQQGNQSTELSVSEIADKYVLQQQQGQPPGQAEGQPKGQHITIDITTLSDNKIGMSEASSDAPPIAEEVEPEPAPKRKRRAIGYSEAFEVFWAGYPDRTNNSKPRAFEQWKALEEPDQNAAVASLPQFAAYCRKNPDYPCVHAERYLSYRRWEAHLPAEPAERPWWQDPEQIARLTVDRWANGINQFAKEFWRADKLGPPPGHPQCIVPPSVVEELRLTDIYTDKGMRRQ
jgi:hypothetical protein